MARNPTFQAPGLDQAQRTGASYSCPVNGGITENVTGNIDCTINGGVSGIELSSAPTVSQLVFTTTEKVHTKAFSWLKALVGAFNQEKALALALVGAFSVIVKTHCETDGALHSSNQETYKETLMGISMEASLEP